VDLLPGAAVLIGSGLTAGVLFSVAISVVPAFIGVSPQRYVEMHKLIGRRYDRVMPPMVLTWTLLDVVLAVRTGVTFESNGCSSWPRCSVVASPPSPAGQRSDQPAGQTPAGRPRPPRLGGPAGALACLEPRPHAPGRVGSRGKCVRTTRVPLTATIRKDYVHA
jgi:hypothetical protein